MERRGCAVVVLLVCAWIGAVDARKSADAGGGGDEEGGSCQEVYMTLYQTGNTNKVALDAGQDGDSGVVMLQDLLKTGTSAGINMAGVCTNLTESMPQYESTCDTDENGDYDTCETLEKEWTCKVAAAKWTEFRSALYKLHSPTADDCASSPAKCMGAPEGSVSCAWTPMPNDQVYPTGLTVTVNGDRCAACGMKEDYCPKYYDVHTCDMALAWQSTQPTDDGSSDYTFTISYTVNSAEKPSSLGMLILAISLTILIYYVDGLHG